MTWRVIVKQSEREAASRYCNDHDLRSWTEDLYDYFDTDLNRVAFFMNDGLGAVLLAKAFNTTVRII